MAKKDTTSEFLKDCMAVAVMRLLEQWPLDKIQVKQICDASGFHRASWFRAFHSKSEAVTYHMVRLWQLFCERHGLNGHNEWVIDNAEAWFQYNYEIRDTLRLLLRRGFSHFSLLPVRPSSSLTMRNKTKNYHNHIGIDD